MLKKIKGVVTSLPARAYAAIAVAAMTNSVFAVDISAAVDDIEQAGEDMNTIGLAMLAATILVVVVGFIRRNVGRV